MKNLLLALFICLPSCVSEAEEGSQTQLSHELKALGWLVGKWKPQTRNVSAGEDSAGKKHFTYFLKDYIPIDEVAVYPTKLSSLRIEPSNDGSSILWSYSYEKSDGGLYASTVNVTERLSWDADRELYRIDADVRGIDWNHHKRGDPKDDRWEEIGKTRKITHFLNPNGTPAHPAARFLHEPPTMSISKESGDLIRKGFTDAQFDSTPNVGRKVVSRFVRQE
jgi:hypothetical protein